MADSIRKVDYFYTTVSDKAGEGARVLRMFKEARVNLLFFSGFPSGRKAQLDFVPQNPASFLAAARKAKIKLSPKKTAFLIEGDDRIGAIADVVQVLADSGINMTSLQAVGTSGGRYGAILWVKPKDVKRAGLAFGIR